MAAAVRARATILAPLAVERLALAGAGALITVRRTGMGPRRSARAGLPAGPGPVVVAGLAGGLAATVRTGDVIVASSVQDTGGTVIELPSAGLLAGELRRNGLTVWVGPVHSSDHLVTGAERAALAAGGALAVDMESGTLLRRLAARPGSGPLAVVRVVVDAADAPLARLGTVSRALRALATMRRTLPAVQSWAAAAGTREAVLAAPRAFCAGVERAIHIVEQALRDHGSPVYVRRQIVHNQTVVRDLERQGAVFVREVDEVPPGAVLVLAAHGVSPQVRAEAAARVRLVIDGTCPLVSKVHAEVRRHAQRGRTVLLIGHADHEEVEGTSGEAPDRVIVVESVEQARTVQVPDPGRLAYAMQTTLARQDADQIMAALLNRFPAMKSPPTDDICYATTNRQQAVQAIAAGCEVVLVLGSENSSNSRRLVEVAQAGGTPAYLLDGAGQVRLSWLAGVQRIGITAGASAPPGLVDELLSELSGLGELSVREHRVAEEGITFLLPSGVA